MDKIIELKDVTKIYGEKIKTQVLFDVDLDVNKGTFNSIIGSSGSGKSTLLNIIGTLDKASHGNVLINGSNTKDMNTDELALLRNETIGFVFQFHYLLNEFSVLENVLIPYNILKGRPNKQTINKAKDLLDMVGLAHVINNKTNEISGGQQQRTAIARALINDPKLILADEPTGNLDTKTGENVYEIFRDINKNMKTSFVIVTHDDRIAAKTDRIIRIVDGRIAK